MIVYYFSNEMQLSQRISTFKEKPVEKKEGEYVSLKKEPEDDDKQGPSDGDEKKAPLGEGEDTDDELGRLLFPDFISKSSSDQLTTINYLLYTHSLWRSASVDNG